MKGFNIPGVVWVVLLLALGIALQAASLWIQTNLGIHPLVVASFISVVFFAAKIANPGNTQLEKAIAMIQVLVAERLQPQTVQPGMRSAGGRLPESVALEPMPEKPETWQKVLWG